MKYFISMAIVGVLLAAFFWGAAQAQQPAGTVGAPAAAVPATADLNLVHNEYFSKLAVDGKSPADYKLTGDVEYRYMGDPKYEVSGYGVALQSGKDINGDGAISGGVTQTVTGIDAKAGRWFRFSFRGLPQENFAAGRLYMKVSFWGDHGKTSLDAKSKELYPLVEQYRKDFTVNGDYHKLGAVTWRNYMVDFYLPFPQVDELHLIVGFDHGAAKTAVNSEFYITRFSLVRIAQPPADPASKTNAPAITTTHFVPPQGKLLPLGGRWFYDAKEGQTAPPQKFDYTNADRLLYHEGGYSAPFVGAMSAWLRVGDIDATGKVAKQDKLLNDNVTIRFDATSMIIHTHGIPNHATGKFPGSNGFGNPNYIIEKEANYYIPLDPKVNVKHIATTSDNSNHALPMGPIGVAINGVVFFNPFDANSMDASSIMDFCCGHPNPGGMYHYHKYPICLNSPWADEGAEHSPLLGFAFDGFPIYGPYESANVMAKDMTGEQALNGFSMHYDKDRGWHYHVTPGKFPYIIGGYWGTEDSRNMRRRGPGGGEPGGGPGGGRQGGFQGGGQNGGPPDGI